SEAAPATPKGRKRLIRKKIEKPEDKDEAVKKTNDKNDKVENNKTDTKKDEKLTKVEKETPTKKRGIAKNISKDDLVLLAKATSDKVKTSIRPKRKSASALILAKAVQKKKALSPKTDPVKRGRKRRNSTGKIDVQRKQSERLRKDDKIRKGRSSSLLKSPDKLIKGARKRLLLPDKTDEKLRRRIKKEKQEPSSDSELLTVSRRRSDSISKCSDMTDISSLMDVPLNQLRDTEELIHFNESPDCIDLKLMDVADNFENKIIVKNKDLDQLGVPVLNDKLIGSDDVTKVEFISPCAVTPAVKEEVEEAFGCKLSCANVLTVATTNTTSDEKEIIEKSASLSPVLESEGISEISVKQFYGQPDFLENNLGIEEDPKLGEIVQVREKTKLDAEIEHESEDFPMTDVSTVEEESIVEENITAEDLSPHKTEMEIDENDDVTLEVTTNGVHEPEEKSVEKINPMEIDEKLTEPEFDDKLTKLEVAKVEDECMEISEEKIKNEEEIAALTNSPKQTITRDEPVIEPENKENIKNNFKESSDEKKNVISMNDENMDVQAIAESPESLRQKETHFLNLGLLTHKAAVAAKIEKQKQREQLQSNRGVEKSDKKKSRQPLKMTLHKGRGKAVNDKETASANNSEDDTYYTIQNEQGDNNTDKTDGAQSRKTHNRNHTSEASVATEPADGTKEIEKELVIPEKASSFRFHPEMLCNDRCFYCGGKFGLFDTPCHVAQIKSVERQQKILENEDKITEVSCLCDACFRHVDRRANCPSYKKRLSATNSSTDCNNANDTTDTQQVEPADPAQSTEVQTTHKNLHKSQMCIVTACDEVGSHTVRRKWFMKTKKMISKLLNLNLDGMAVGTLSLCDSHYDVISHLMICTLCKRKLLRNHIYYLSKELPRLQDLLKDEAIPVVIGTSPVVCKLCRYYANLLIKPPELRSHKSVFLKNYSKRPPKRPRLSQESTSTPPSITSDSGDKSSNQSTGQMVVDSDVMVDYDPPAMYNMASIMPNKVKSKGLSMSIEPKPSSSKEDISILRGNPNISMRELFPGEEEMGLQVNVPFNSGGQRTPEGWTKIMTTIQYDDPTRHLWEELQKPYGNQSSFLRHLILLEKYFRNGDLVLSPGATFNAVNYSESVQQRLQSFDSRCTLNNSLNNLYKMTNSPISIFPATKAKPKPSSTETTTAQANIIRLPDVLSPAERLESNKWRPTLMPVSSAPPTLDGQLYQSADGRKLPSLVQVQSGGKPYLISIHDYNRMCIMRRERLLREQMIERQQQAQQSIASQQKAMANQQSLLQKMQHQPPTGQLSATQQQPVSLLPVTKSTTSNPEENTNKISMSITQIPNKILEQNSVIPLNSKSSTLDSLLKVRKTNSASLLKPNLQSNNPSKSSNSISTINQQNVISITSTPSISAILNAQPPPAKSPTLSASSALDALMKTTQQATQSKMWSWTESLNSNGSVVIDNSAATLLSKIPKSLTVIPQQKSRSSKSCSED
ncbi:hypothetical protein Bhyg_15980, partial [Pseudolycoriella hygida]